MRGRWHHPESLPTSGTEGACHRGVETGPGMLSHIAALCEEGRGGEVSSPGGTRWAGDGRGVGATAAGLPAAMQPAADELCWWGCGEQLLEGLGLVV